MSSHEKMEKPVHASVRDDGSLPSSAMSRRRFLRGGSGIIAAAGGAVFLSKASAVESRLAFKPDPTLNGRTAPFPIPWLDKNGNHNETPENGTDPSNIFHFKGRVARCGDFTGIGTDNKGNRIGFGGLSTNFSFMQGEYFSARSARTGTFAHLGLALFRGAPVTVNKLHDFHPPTAPSGLFGMASVPDGGLTISPDGRAATLILNNLPVIDQPEWPSAEAKSRPARMSVRVTWTATEEPLLYEDKCRHFRLKGYRAASHAAVSVEVPSIGFSWKSDPIETSSARFGLIGSEVNGKYYDIVVL